MYELEKGDQMNKIRLLQNIIYIVSTLGGLMGIDFHLGAKMTSYLNKTLNRTVLDFDKLIASVLSHFKKVIDLSINIDKKLIKTESRMILGFLFIAVSVVLIFIARKG